jgi:hypothetical protein
LKHPFDIVQDELIIRKDDITEKIKGVFIVADVTIESARASYTISEHKGTLGNLDRLQITALSPDLPILNKNWKYDALVKIHANEEFLLLTNIV